MAANPGAIMVDGSNERDRAQRDEEILGHSHVCSVHLVPKLQLNLRARHFGVDT